MDGTMVGIIILALYSLFASIGLVYFVYLHLRNKETVGHNGFRDKPVVRGRPSKGPAPRAPPKEPWSKTKLQKDLERQQENRDKALPIQTIGMSQPPSVTQRTKREDIPSVSSEETVYDDVIRKSLSQDQPIGRANGLTHKVSSASRATEYFEVQEELPWDNSKAIAMNPAGVEMEEKPKTTSSSRRSSGSTTAAVSSIALDSTKDPNKSTAYTQQLSEMSDLPTPQLRKWQNREALNKDQTISLEDRPERVSEEVAKARKSYQEAPKAYRKESSYVQAGKADGQGSSIRQTQQSDRIEETDQNAELRRKVYPEDKMPPDSTSSGSTSSTISDVGEEHLNTSDHVTTVHLKGPGPDVSAGYKTQYKHWLTKQKLNDVNEGLTYPTQKHHSSSSESSDDVLPQPPEIVGDDGHPLSETLEQELEELAHKRSVSTRPSFVEEHQNAISTTDSDSSISSSTSESEFYFQQNSEPPSLPSDLGPIKPDIPRKPTFLKPNKTQGGHKSTPMKVSKGHEDEERSSNDSDQADELALARDLAGSRTSNESGPIEEESDDNTLPVSVKLVKEALFKTDPTKQNPESTRQDHRDSVIVLSKAEKIQGTPIITVHKKPSRPLAQDAKVKVSNQEEATNNGTDDLKDSKKTADDSLISQMRFDYESVYGERGSLDEK